MKQQTKDATPSPSIPVKDELFTGGEWEAHEVEPGLWAIKEAGLMEKGYSDRIAELHEYPANVKANAYLIAAAPDLLKALQAMDDLDQLPHLSGKWWKQAEKCDRLRDAAIKKATPNK